MRITVANSTYPQVAVQWLNQGLCFYLSLCLVDSEVLRNRHLRVAAKRYKQFQKKMKKLIFLAFTVALTTSLFGQDNKNHIEINSQFNPIDTSRTYTIFNTDFDSCRYKLLKYWGTPSINETGSIIWTNIEIPNIGKELKIVLTDWICWKDEKYGDTFCNVFTDENDKSEKLNKYKSDRARHLEIIIKNKLDKNIIVDVTKTEIFIDLIKRIIR